jgi:hypothetical protein
MLLNPVAAVVARLLSEVTRVQLLVLVVQASLVQFPVAVLFALVVVAAAGVLIRESHRVLAVMVVVATAVVLERRALAVMDQRILVLAAVVEVGSRPATH